MVSISRSSIYIWGKKSVTGKQNANSEATDTFSFPIPDPLKQDGLKHVLGISCHKHIKNHVSGLLIHSIAIPMH